LQRGGDSGCAEGKKNRESTTQREDDRDARAMATRGEKRKRVNTESIEVAKLGGTRGRSGKRKRQTSESLK